MEAGTFAAPTAVASVVGGLWWGRWDLRGQRDHVTELLGDPCVHVVCERGDDGDVARVVGVWSRLWTRRLTGRGQVRGLKLRIGAAAQLLPVPARQVTDRRVPLEELFPETRGLASAVMSAPREEGLQVLVAWARTMLRPTVEGQEVIALAEGIGPAGVLRVDELAERSGRTVRWLQRRFRHHVGLSPKAVIRRHRLQEVALQVERGDAPDLADLAYRLGYADQSHLARDFRAVTGLTLRGFEARLRR